MCVEEEEGNEGVNTQAFISFRRHVHAQVGKSKQELRYDVEYTS